MKRYLFLALTAATSAAFLAGPAAAQLVSGTSGQPAGMSRTGSDDVSDLDAVVNEAETQGTIASGTPDPGTVTIVDEGGNPLTCSVPAGVDLTSFLGGPVEAKCELVGGVLTLTKIKSEDAGVEVEVNDDGTVEAQGADDQSKDDLSADDEQEGDHSGPSADSEQDDDHSGSSASSGSGGHDDSAGDNEADNEDD